MAPAVVGAGGGGGEASAAAGADATSLFSLEVFADRLDACPARGAAARRRARLAVRLLDFPLVALPRADDEALAAADEPAGADSDVVLPPLPIGAGRSCLFAERAPRLVRLLEAVPLYVLLLDCEGDLDADSARPHLLAAGSTRLELFPEEHSLHGRYLREEVPLYTPMGAPAGLAQLRVRLACRGAAMLRSVRVAAGQAADIAEKTVDEAAVQTPGGGAAPAVEERLNAIDAKLGKVVELTAAAASTDTAAAASVQAVPTERVADAMRSSAAELAAALAQAAGARADAAEAPAGLAASPEKLAELARAAARAGVADAPYEAHCPPLITLSREGGADGEYSDDDASDAQLAPRAPDRDAPWYGSIEGPLAALISAHLSQGRRDTGRADARGIAQGASGRRADKRAAGPVARSGGGGSQPRRSRAPSSGGASGASAHRRRAGQHTPKRTAEEHKVTIHPPSLDVVVHTPRESPSRALEGGTPASRPRPAPRPGPRRPPTPAELPRSAATPARRTATPKSSIRPHAGDRARAATAGATGGIVAQLANELAALCGLTTAPARGGGRGGEVAAVMPGLQSDVDGRSGRTAVVRALGRTLAAVGAGQDGQPQPATDEDGDGATVAATVSGPAQNASENNETEGEAAQLRREVAALRAELQAMRESGSGSGAEAARSSRRAPMARVETNARPPAAAGRRVSQRKAAARARAPGARSSDRAASPRPATAVEDVVLSLDSYLSTQRQRCVRMFMAEDSESRGSLLPEQVLALASGLLPGVPQAQLDYLRAMLAEAGGRASASSGGRTSFAALCDAVRAGADAAALAARRAALRSRAVSGRGASVGGAEDALWRVSLRLQGAGARLSDMFVEEERRGGAGDGLLSLAQVVRIVREALRGNLSPADARCVVASAFRASALRDGRVSVNEFRDALLQPQDPDFDPPRRRVRPARRLRAAPAAATHEGADAEDGDAGAAATASVAEAAAPAPLRAQAADIVAPVDEDSDGSPDPLEVEEDSLAAVEARLGARAADEERRAAEEEERRYAADKAARLAAAAAAAEAAADAMLAEAEAEVAREGGERAARVAEAESKAHEEFDAIVRGGGGAAKAVEADEAGSAVAKEVTSEAVAAAVLRADDAGDEAATAAEVFFESAPEERVDAEDARARAPDEGAAGGDARSGSSPSTERTDRTDATNEYGDDSFDSAASSATAADVGDLAGDSGATSAATPTPEDSAAAPAGASAAEAAEVASGEADEVASVASVSKEAMPRSERYYDDSDEFEEDNLSLLEDTDLEDTTDESDGAGSGGAGGAGGNAGAPARLSRGAVSNVPGRRLA